jgi:hypothetical protein
VSRISNRRLCGSVEPAVNRQLAALVRRTSTLVPVVFLMLPVVVLFALYPGLFTLSRLAR